MKTRLPLLAVAATLASVGSHALTPVEYQAGLAAANPGLAPFSAQRGAAFHRSTHGGTGDAWSCSTCHTDNPAATGSHAVTKKAIRPLAPAANAERFTSADKIDKWFKRNCNDVLKRACTAQEKGDFVAWLLSVKP